MKAIIIGAGRGSRLKHKTDEIPKTLVEVMGRPMLDWILEAFSLAGIKKEDIVFIAGYSANVIRERYPELRLVMNHEWEQNNILGSLMCAQHLLGDGFICSYADIIYDAAIVERLLNSPEDLCLGCDTDWRRRYINRSQHPESDAEKLSASGRVITQISRQIPSEAAQGEFIGVLKASPAGAAQLVQAYEQARARFAGQHYREGRSFERAYLLDLLADMLESGVLMHREDTHGGYMEIDTLEDHAHAQKWWAERRDP